MYVCRYMIKSIGICFACDRNGNPFEIRCESDILNYFSALYLNTESSFVAGTNDFQHYNILPIVRRLTCCEKQNKLYD